MLIADLFIWWYGRGWKDVATGVPKRLAHTLEAFSFVQLTRTLFAPWRRIITYPGATIGEKGRAIVDNLVSRFIGTIVRFMVLLAGVIALVVISITSFIEILLWPLVPVIIVAAFVKGLL